jgi:hypothetical protein
MKTRLPFLLLIIVVVVFIAGLFELFTLRFEAGDVYPAYSSLRADPLGTMALFESLSRMRGVRVERDFSATDALPEGRFVTYLHLASSRDEWLFIPEESVQVIQGFVLQGGRLIVTFAPETSRPYRGPTATGTPRRRGTAKTPVSPLLKDRWDIEMGFEALESAGDGVYAPAQVHRRADLPLPAALEWHSGMIFTNANTAWTPIYTRGTNPVVIERKFGAGSVVLMTDTFCLSNEAMAMDRHPELLAWLLGPANLVEFDEAHMGVVESSGVAALMRKYRLHGLLAGLCLLTALFIWKHSLSFNPRTEQEKAGGEIAGKDAAAGFVNLLRRNIAPRDLLRVCFEEWTKSFGRRGAHSIARVDLAHAVFEAERARAKPDQDPVRAYREIRQTLRAGRSNQNQTTP